MKWWNGWSSQETEIDIYKIYSDGRLLRNSGVAGEVYLNSYEVGVALSLD